MRISRSVLAAHGLNAEMVEIQKVARDFARKEMYPNMAEWDREVIIAFCFFFVALDTNLKRFENIEIILKKICLGVLPCGDDEASG